MRKSLSLLIALICGTVVTLIANQWLNAQAGSQQESDTTEVFVAKVAIDIGEEITPEKIRLEQWPADKIPEGATGDFEGLEGKYAKQRFYTGEAIMPVKLMDENWTTVPKGFSVVAMKANNVSIANLIQPGDRVDVLAYFEKSDLIPQTMTKTVLMGVRVYALDGDTERRAGEDRPKMVRNIQLLIHKKDQQAWAYAGELGSIQLALGSDADYTAEDGSNQAATEFLAWLEEYRTAQEQAKKQQPPQRADTAEIKQREDGFSMFKMVEDRMVEYWIVPGKLPVRIGEFGGEDEVNGEPGTTTTTGQPNDGRGADDAESDEYSYLNGEDSPLFQPPTNRSGSRNRRSY